MTPIMLKEVFRIENLSDYKVHFDKWNQKNQPLDVFTKDRQQWQSWQEYRPSRDEFNRPMIFALASFYHEPAIWLFGGIFKVLKRHVDRYEVELMDIGASFIGRLKLRSPYNSRTVRVNMEDQYENFEVAEILREPYTGRAFPGYEELDSDRWRSEQDRQRQHSRGGQYEFWGNEFKDATFESALTQGNTQGITFVASSGDSGSNGGTVSTPAAEPQVLALGGTIIKFN